MPDNTAVTRLRVLVVDDCHDTTETMAMLFRLWGHDVRVAHDGPSALAQARGEPPDMVFLDIGLPGMDGYEVARRLRRQPGGGRVFLVALTGYGQEEDRRRAREAGFDAYLVKPVDPDALRELLAQHRGRHPEAVGGARH
jgi:CheY-like chemotaxis protein